jgi:phosphoenolpyruvate phosphomutase
LQSNIKILKREFQVAVPSTYNSVSRKELEEAGFNIIIYANHLLRSAYPAMLSTATSILENDRSKEVEESLMTVKDLLKLMPDNYDPS